MSDQPPSASSPFCCPGQPAEQDDARSRILETATRLFAEKGFAATSIREISQAAGVTNPTIYYHFGSKSGLYHCIVAESNTAVREHVERLLEDASSFRAGLVGWLMAYFTAARQNPHLLRMHFATAIGLVEPPEGLDLRQLEAERRAHLQAMLRRGQEAGCIRRDLALDAIQNLLAGCLLIPMLHFMTGVQDCLSQTTAEQLIDLFLNGAAPPKQEP